MDAKQAFWLWSEQQQKLRRMLQRPDQHAEAIALFLSQHAMLHAAEIAPGTAWSFANAAASDLGDGQLRTIPRGHNQSIAWLIWHCARTEDVAMNMLLAGTPQLLESQGWNARLNLSVRDIGTSMTDAEVADLSARVDLAALHEYRLAVGRRTREIVQSVGPLLLKQPVEPARLQRVRDTGALVSAAYEVAEYWGRHPIMNLLLMPATRHNMTHLNEALRIHARVGKLSERQGG
jgi:hypothetical protein